MLTALINKSFREQHAMFVNQLSDYTKKNMDGFDIDEFPIQIETYYERVIAWRLIGGGWVRLKSYSERMDQCKKHMVTLPVELSDDMPR